MKFNVTEIQFFEQMYFTYNSNDNTFFFINKDRLYIISKNEDGYLIRGKGCNITIHDLEEIKKYYNSIIGGMYGKKEKYVGVGINSATFRVN